MPAPSEETVDGSLLAMLTIVANGWMLSRSSVVVPGSPQGLPQQPWLTIAAGFVATAGDEAHTSAFLAATRDEFGAPLHPCARFLQQALQADPNEVSRIEQRPDFVLETTRRYAEALGARCEVAFVFADGRRILIA